MKTDHHLWAGPDVGKIIQMQVTQTGILRVLFIEKIKVLPNQTLKQVQVGR